MYVLKLAEKKSCEDDLIKLANDVNNSNFKSKITTNDNSNTNNNNTANDNSNFNNKS